MVYFTDSQTYLQQSILLLEARPTTARISTRYRLNKAPPEPPADSTLPPPPRGVLVLKTFDPISGACLKYKTNKAAEVGRLVAAMGKCARVMAAVPPLEEKSEAPEAKSEAAEKVEEKSEQKLQAGGGGKKKKKGKK